MASFAYVGGIRMTTRFALRDAAIMTTYAGANHLIVIERRNKW